jgi:hypothetical protein
MQPSEILKETAKHYASVRTYQDVGTFLTTTAGKENEQAQLDFKTYFQRPCLLRYETVQPNRKTDSRFVLWCDGAKVARQSGAYTQQLSKHLIFRTTLKDLERALASSSEAQPVVNLLLPELAGKRLSALEKVALVGEEVQNGEACYHLQAMQRHGSTDVWIRKDNYIVTKLVETSEVASNETLKVGAQTKSSNRSQVTNTYDFKNVWIDQEIHSALFQIPAN